MATLFSGGHSNTFHLTSGITVISYLCFARVTVDSFQQLSGFVGCEVQCQSVLILLATGSLAVFSLTVTERSKLHPAAKYIL